MTAACPFLVGTGTTWGAAVPAAERRCGAVDPPEPLSPEKQTRLCLTTGHLDCPLYEAAAGPTVRPMAMAAADSRGGGPFGTPGNQPHEVDPPDQVDEDPSAVPPPPPTLPSRRPIPRTNPVVLDRGRSAPQMRFPGGPRTPGGSGGLGSLPPVLRGRGIQIGLAGLIAVALVAVLVVRFGSSDKPGASPSASLRASASIASSPGSSAIPTDSPSSVPVTAAPVVSPKPTANPTKTPTAKTYKVKAGDTLTSIAAKFGTTAAILQKLNNIKDPRKLQVGQILKLP